MAMIVVGELINSTRGKIKEAMESRNAGYLKDLAKKQDEAGADFIDVNAGAFVTKEMEILPWALEEVMSVTDKPIAVDSPRAEAVKLGLEMHKNGKPMLNSITKESERWNTVLPIAVEHDCLVLGLCIDDQGIPEDADRRIKIADGIINGLIKEGKDIQDIAIDPITTPLSVNTGYGLTVIDTIKGVKENFPQVKLITGFSNISYGLPARRQVNRAFVVACMVNGLDGALIDPLDTTMMSLIKATEALLNRDPFCSGYLKAYRAGLVTKD
jgi:5-methyltetrahydrofolate--homocysteine methyltransferase